MQISRHWRLQPQRYRLQGYRYEDGTLSLQNRPVPQKKVEIEAHKKPYLMPVRSAAAN